MKGQHQVEDNQGRGEEIVVPPPEVAPAHQAENDAAILGDKERDTRQEQEVPPLVEKGAVLAPPPHAAQSRQIGRGGEEGQGKCKDPECLKDEDEHPCRINGIWCRESGREEEERQKEARLQANQGSNIKAGCPVLFRKETEDPEDECRGEEVLEGVGERQMAGCGDHEPQGDTVCRDS